MKVELLNSKKIYFTSQVNDDCASLLGKNAIKNYVNIQKQHQQEDDEKYFEVQQVIYNSLQSLASYGKYTAFKSLFKNIEQEEELKQDAYLYNSAGDVYRAEHDIEKAHRLYENAYEYAQNTDGKTFFEIERNYLESCLQLGQNIDRQLETLKNRNLPNSTVNYLELDSFKNLKEGNIKKAKEEVLCAYFIAKNHDIINDNLYYKAAVIMASDSNYEQSTIICKNRLDRLKKEGKTFTHEFLNYLTLLGVNNLQSATNSTETDKAKNTLLNALELEKTVNDPVIKEELLYNLLKLDFEKPNKNTIFNQAAEFINSSKNKSHQKVICQKTADYALQLGKEQFFTTKESKEISKPYFDKLEEILISNNNPDNKELINLYIKLQEVYPELESEYSTKLNKLNNNYDLPIKNMLSNIKYHLNNNNEETLQKILNSIIQDPKIDDIRKGIATDYKLLLKIGKGIDFTKTTDELLQNVSKLYNLYKKDSSNKLLAEHIYDTYNRLSNIQYNAGRYSDSAISSDRVEEIAKDLDLPQVEREKIKVFSTLRNYKAKYYCRAESRCLEFLQMISGIDRYQAKKTSIDKFISGKTESQCKKIASTFETLGIINLKNNNYNDSIEYYKKAVDLRQKLSSKDIYLANDYAALARLAILGYSIFDDNISSKEMHNKCLAILDDKFPNEQITIEEHEFHKKYYGFGLSSFGKYMPWRNTDAIIDKFKCYNRELNICE